MRDLKIDPVFLRGHRKQSIRCWLIILAYTILLSLPIVIELLQPGGSELLRYVPEILGKTLTRNGVMIISGISGMIVIYFFGRKPERIRYNRNLTEATMVLQSATPIPVTVHVWWSDFEYQVRHSSNTIRPYCTLAADDLSAAGKPRVFRIVQLVTLLNSTTVIYPKELTTSAEWFTDPALSSIALLRFPDGLVVRLDPVEEPTLVMPPLPRRVSGLTRFYLRTGAFISRIMLPFLLLISVFVGQGIVPNTMRRLAFSLLPTQSVTAKIVRIGAYPTSENPIIVYQDGQRNQQILSAGDGELPRIPPGTTITVDSLRANPQRKHIRESPFPADDFFSRATLTPLLIFGVFALLMIIGSAKCAAVANSVLRALESYALGQATLTSVDNTGGKLKLSGKTITVNLRDEAGETRQLTVRNAVPTSWTYDIGIPVLFDPADPTHIIPFARMQLISGGKIGVTAKGLLTIDSYPIIAGTLLSLFFLWLAGWVFIF